jgi:dynein heavy chain 2
MATVSDNGGVKFSLKLADGADSNAVHVVFVKRSFQAITPDNIGSCLDVHSTRGSALDGLYNAVKEIWCPALLQNAQVAEKVPPKVQQLLTELANALGTSSRQDLGDAGGADINQVSNIFEPADEIRFWASLKDDRRSPFKGLAKNVDKALSDISSPGFSDLESFDLVSILDLLSRTQDALNLAYSSPAEGQRFPQSRMEYLFGCFGGSICRFVQRALKGVDVWRAHAGDVRLKLQEAVRVCEAWADIPRKLTSSYWGDQGDAPWRGGPFEDGFTVAFQARLEQIIRIRTQNDELSQLLTKDERLSFRVDSLFEPLEGTNPLMYNPYTEPQWAKAVKQYEKLLEPIEAAVAGHMRKNIVRVQDKPQLLLQEFRRAQSLLERPAIRRALASEREVLLSLLREQLKKVEQSVDRIETNGRDDSDDEEGGGSSAAAVAGAARSSRLLSPTVACLVKLRQLASRVTAVLGTSRQLLSDLNDFSRLEDLGTTLIGRIRQEENTRFKAWVTDTQEAISGESDSIKLKVSLKLKGVMMGWKNGALVVNFSDELVRFLRDVRQLDDLDFQIPRGAAGRRGDKSKSAGIGEYAAEVEKYYRYGIILKKTANFYNSIAEQMIDVQEQLLLVGIKKFLTVVSADLEAKGESGMSWSSTAEVEHYIRRVQEAGEALSMENRRLRKLHEWFITMTISLMYTDMLKQRDVWKGKWRSLKDKMDAFKAEYRDEKNNRSWILHWDHQVYKALEANYQHVLESLNENTSEIKVELVFVGKRLEFKPPMESIRQTYYGDMKNFVAMPNIFDGFGNSAVYRKMGPRNSKRIVQVFVKAEKLFDKLGALLQKYSKLVLLGQINDMDAFIEANVHTTEEFTANFKELKNRRKEAEKLPDSEKIDCCTVSLMPFKAYLDELFNKINESLLISLRRLLLSEFNEVHQFLESAREHLSAPPHSVAEIAEAKRRWKEFDSKKDSMKSVSRACGLKKALLLQYAPGTGIDITEISVRMANLDGEGGRWDDFDISLEAYNDLIENQKEVFKSTIESDVIALNTDIDRMGNRWRQLKPSEVKSYEYQAVIKVFTEIEEWRTQFTVLEQTANTLTESCLSFSMPKPRFDGLEALVEDLKNTTASWTLLKGYIEEITTIGDQDWLGFSVNVYSLLDFSTKWTEAVKASNIRDMISEYIMSNSDKIKRSMPALKYCQGEPFKDDHWTELLQNKLQLPKEIRAKNVKVSHFLSRLEILVEPSTLSFVKNLSARALGEVQIREALAELRMWELSEELSLLTTVESGRRLPLIKDWKDLFITMGDKQSLLSSLKESQFFHAFADQGEVLEIKMGTLDSVLQTLNSIQRKWLYLEPIFGRGALPSEKERFRRVDEQFSDIMTSVSSDPKLFNLADERMFPKLADKLRSMLDQLERCQKALTEFLEAKRHAMPRFYFIGDDDLLEILGQAKNPVVIQSHLKKLFQGINKVKFNADNTQIVAMISSANEVVQLETPVKISEKVEEWLEQLTVEMKATLTALLARCLSSPTFSWAFPSQILCLSQQIKFTDEAEAAIEEGGLDALHKQLLGQLKKFTSLDMANQPLEQLKMKALVMDLVHNIDVVEQLKAKRTNNTEQWQWKKQLRYYFESNKAVVKMGDAKFAYTYEYQGNAPKLVHTPLTDKCYLTLTQGMNMGFGGNPYGPAGTGKTESVKALAAAMGRQVLVFNCDEGIDFLSMGRIFIGLVKCGAWGCFDEFNRLKEDQLSAISQQIQTIQDAIKMRSSPVHLLGRNIDVDFNAGIFVTLNPAGKGYGGRSRLPDNLKALFRPVAMGVPDNELIAEVNLVTEGFSQSRDLASKIVSLFKLSRQLLSPQQHYDWGLRALKAVLNSGGRLIQSYKARGEAISSTTEYEILIKAVRVNTLSKLTFGDTSKFLALIGDVFPGVNSSDIAGGDLEVAIREVMKEKPFFLVEDSAQIKKMIQLKESLDQRMGCVIVGPSGCGKSVLWRVLKAAMLK